MITSFATFDPRKGTPRAWVFGIARRIYAAHCQAHSQQRRKVERLAGRRELAPGEIGELIDRIGAERAGRAPVTRADQAARQGAGSHPRRVADC